MGGGESSEEPKKQWSKDEVDAMVRNKELEALNASLRQQQKQAEKCRDEQQEQQRSWMKANEEQMEKYMKLIAETGGKCERDKRLDFEVERLEAAAADAERKLKEQEDHLRQVETLMELKEKNVEEAVKEASILNEKYQQLEKDKEDWKKAQEAKYDQMMKESPPPRSLRINKADPKSALYTHEMPCFAFMGRSGTGKSTMINKLVETFTGAPIPPEQMRKQGAVTETTQGCPAAVFTKTSEGRDIALFDRPGVGIKALKLAEEAAGDDTDATTAFIRDQGLRWWTAIILNIDRDATQQEALIYAMAKAIGTPILVTRNKMTETLEKEKGDCEVCGDIYDEKQAVKKIEEYITGVLNVDKSSYLMVDNRHPDQFQWKELVAYIEKQSQREATAGGAEM